MGRRLSFEETAFISRRKPWNSRNSQTSNGASSKASCLLPPKEDVLALMIGKS